MRRRPWVLVVALLILALSFSIVVGIRYLNRSNRLRNELLEAFSGLPGTLTIGAATLESSTLQLTNIQYLAPDTSVTVDIRRISLRLALSNLVGRSGGIERIIQSVAITKPTVSLSVDKLAMQEQSGQELPDLSNYTFLERIILRDGVLRLMNHSDAPWVEMQGISGWFVTTPQHRLNFELAASLYQDTLRSMMLDGSIDLKDLSLQSKLNLNHYDLKNLKLPEASPFDKVAGNLDLHAKADLDSSGFVYSAHWQLDHGAIHIRGGPKLDGLELSGLVEEGLSTADGTMLFEGDSTDFHASLNLNGPLVIDAEAFLPKARIGKHLGTFAGLKPAEQPQGLLRARFTFHSEAESGWYFRGHATSDHLKTPIGTFSDVVTDVHWDHEAKSIVFDYLDAEWFGLSARAVGRYNFGRVERFPVHIDVEGIVDPTILPDWTEPLRDKQVNGIVTLQLTPGVGWTIRTEGRARNVGDPTLGEFTGLYDRNGYDLNLNLFSSQYQNASVRMWAEHHNPVHLSVSQPQLLSGWWSEDYAMPERVKQLDILTNLRFATNRITGGGEVHDPATGFSMQFAGTTDHIPDQPESVVMSYTFKRHESMIGNGDVSFTHDKGLVTIGEWSFMDFLYGDGVIDLQKREVERFEIAVEDLDVAELLPAMTSIGPEKVDGRINGRFTVNGPFRQPVVASHFELSEGRYGDLDQYWGLLTVDSDIQGNVNILQGAVGHAGRTLLTLDGGYNIPEHKLDVAVSSPGSDARVLSQALTGRDDLLLGTISVVGRVGGSLTLPRWTMNLGMQDARVLGIRFNTISLALRGESSRRLGHVLYIDEFDLNRPQHYRFQAFGAAPLSRGAGQLSFLLNGDLPELLPQMTSFVKSGEGKGELNWIVTMVGGKPASSQGNLKLENGSLKFDSIFPEMENINIDVDVDVDGHTSINRFEASLGQSARRIIATNEPGDPLDPEKIPVIVRTLGLDLGVLKLKTPDSDGIPMRLPAISSTPEYANVKFSGIDNAEWFVVSGPTDSLMVRGEATISNVVFTLPSKEGGSSDRKRRSGAAEFAISSLKDVILAARWDAQLNIGRDVRFEYLIGGLEDISLANAFNLLGQVSLDLELESTESERPLRAHGSLVDDSFRLGGTITSTQGDIEFLDLVFEMQRAEVTFDQTSLLPVVSARALSNVVETGTDYSRRVYLTLYVIDPVTGERTTRGRWGEFTLVLEDEDGSSQEQVASSLGISPTAIRDRATLLGAGGLEKAVTRMWLRPIERDVERWLGLDLVRIDPTIAQNLASDPTAQNGTNADSAAAKRVPVDYFRASSVTVGKYLTRDLFLSYTGQLGKDPRYTTVEEYQSGRIGLLQTWSLQYRLSEISPNFVIQGDWEYDNLADVQQTTDPDALKNNRSIKLKYTFVFDATKLQWP